MRLRSIRIARAPIVATLALVVVAGVAFLVASRASMRADPAPAAATAAEPSAVFALTTNVYERPTRASELVAIIPEGRSARVTASTEDGQWLRVVYPVESSVEGWAPRSNARAGSLPDLAALPVAQSTPTPGEGAGGGPALPDLTVSSAEVQPNGRLVVRVTNAGAGAFSGKTDLEITDAEGGVMGSVGVDLTQSSLGPGRSAAVDTGVVVRKTGLVVVEVDHRAAVPEANESNNSRRVLLVGVGG